MTTIGQQQALFGQFRPALQQYHTGGSHNGGGVEGIQLPVDVGRDQLEPFMDQVATYLSRQPDIVEKEPGPGVKDSDFRKQLQKQSAATVKAHKQLYIQTGVCMIASPVIAEMVSQALKQAPSEFFSAPSSSSGRYHPADEINDGGLVLHSLRDEIMGAKLVDFFNQSADQNTVGPQKISGEQRDLILGALLLHDIEKGGVPWDGYDPAHGPEGATFLEGVWKDSPHQAFAQEMEELVNNHMAQWNKDSQGNKDPKVPHDVANQIVSYADYLGSQRNVFVQPFPGQDN